MSLSITKLIQSQRSLAHDLVNAKIAEDYELVEELEIELAEIEEDIEAIQLDEAEDRRFGRM